MVVLNWEQVTAWRLQQHYLLHRAGHKQMLSVVSRLGGVHAQLMSAAELQLWARVESLSPAEVQNALWDERTLVKTWALRGTLHLLAADDFPLYVAALSTLRHFRRGSWQKYHGVTLDELEALMEGVRTTLNGSGITREQLAKTLAERTNMPKLSELLRSGWGALLKPAAFQGYLCFGPSEGQNVTFVQPAAWLGEWTPVEPQAALQEVARRFLNAYGPATVDEFARWFGLEPSDAKRVFRSLGDEIEEIEVEGWKAQALASSIGQMQKLNPPDVVRFLPHFDPYTLAVARHSQHLLSDKHKGRVYRPQGWISPVVLVNGRIEGIWEYEKLRSKIVVTASLFEKSTQALQQSIEAEAARLGQFLGAEVEVVFSN